MYVGGKVLSCYHMQRSIYTSVVAPFPGLPTIQSLWAASFPGLPTIQCLWAASFPGLPTIQSLWAASFPGLPTIQSLWAAFIKSCTMSACCQQKWMLLHELMRKHLKECPPPPFWWKCKEPYPWGSFARL